MARLRVPNNPERLAYRLHRVTGLILLAYFMAHAVSMGGMLAGYTWLAEPAAAIVSSKTLRFAVAAAAAFHGLNGLRLILVEALGLGLGKPGIPRPPYISTSLRSAQRLLLHFVVVLAGLAAALAAYLLIAW
ncbi:succinate dehydrogenase [Pyrodictium delaneyi]|uniref:succinate dehydrogenase n=1 Tax=Pyrodictium delaneyi TaxID=1273541 RepID=UPI0015D7F3F6|nr:succinate dehydrogenase [Pyrodictium delaneyi]